MAAASAALAPSGTATPQQLAYFNLVLPYALKQQRRTGIPAAVLIVQSGVETGWGTSGWFTQNNNPAGIGVTGASGAGNSYVNLDAGFAAYADKLMGVGEGGQQQFVQDVQGGASSATLLSDIEQSPWASGHYGGTGLDTAYNQVFAGKGGNAIAGTTYTPGADLTANHTPASTLWDVLTGKWEASVFGNLPVVGGVFKAAGTASELVGVVLGLMQNWRYFVEVIGGIIMVGFGVWMLTHDALAPKADEAAKVAALAA